MAKRMAVLRGTLDVLVLKSLSWGPMHAFEITSWLEERSDGHLSIDDSALLQALHRMEERDLIEAEWGVTENNRRARYYEMTSKGRVFLASEGTKLRAYTAVLAGILAARAD